MKKYQDETRHFLLDFWMEAQMWDLVMDAYKRVNEWKRENRKTGRWCV